METLRDGTMTRRMHLIAATAGATLISTAAFAADIPALPPAPPAPVVPTFSWEGSYAGPHAEYLIGLEAIGGGVTVGHNFVKGSLVYGLEAEITLFQALPIPGVRVFQALLGGRVGYSFGRALIYAEAHGGFLVAPGSPRGVLAAGAGIEFAINDRISTFAEVDAYLHGSGFGYAGLGVQAGVAWHF
jgi:hypothetical protein